MIYVTCISKFVDPQEVGKQWAFPSIADAEDELGWFFVHNHCRVREWSQPCGYAGCSYCDPQLDY